VSIMGQDVVRKAREYLGTPFHHQGRLKGIGIDCVGLVFCTAKELGLLDGVKDCFGYSRSPDGSTFMQETSRALMPLEVEEAMEGDVLAFWMTRSEQHRYPQHMGFCTDIGLLHTYASSGCVVEHGLDARWQRRILGAFRIPGVTN